MRTLIVSLFVVMVVLTGCESPVTSEPATVTSTEIQYNGETVYTQSVTLDVVVTWSDGVTKNDTLVVEAPENVPGSNRGVYTADGIEEEVVVYFDVPVSSVEIDYNNFIVYDSSINLSVTITHADNSTSNDSITINAPSTGAGEVTGTYTTGGHSDSVTVTFEDWRLVGTWDGADTIFLYNNGSIDINSLTDVGTWKTENDNLILEYIDDNIPDDNHSYSISSDGQTLTYNSSNYIKQ